MMPSPMKATVVMAHSLPASCLLCRPAWPAPLPAWPALPRCLSAPARRSRGSQARLSTVGTVGLYSSPTQPA